MAKKGEKTEEAIRKRDDDKEKINNLLIENFVGLQKVLTNLGIKFDMLSDKISKNLDKEDIIKKKEEEKEKLNKMLIENFVNLQKVLANLGSKFDMLSDKISKLLELFEISAKNFAEKQNSREKAEEREQKSEAHSNEKEKEFLEKVDSLLDQNKTIAKGLTLIEEKLREKNYDQYPSSNTIRRPRYPNI